MVDPEKAIPESNVNTSNKGKANNQTKKELPTEFLWKVHQYIQEHIRFSDTKCGLTITLASALLAGLYAAKLHQNIFTSASIGAAFGFLVASILLAGWSVWPRLWPPKKRGFIFWEDIKAHGSGKSFGDELRSRNEHEVYDFLASQVFAIANVCSAKFRWFGWAFRCLFIGGILAAVVLYQADSTTMKGDQSAKNPAIGLVLPLSGSLSFMGQPERNGCQLAIEDYKRSDSSKHKNVRLEIEDSQSTSQGAVTATQKLLQIDKPFAVLLSNTGPNLAVAPITERNKVLHVAFCMEPDIQKQHERLFRLYESATQEGEAILEYLRSRQPLLKKIGFLYIDQANFVKTVETTIAPELKSGAQAPTLILERYRLDQESYREVLLKFQQEKIECLVLLGYGSEYRLIFDQMTELGILGSFEIVGGWGFLYPQLSDERLEGIRVAAPLSAVSDDQISSQFRQRYLDQYKTNANFDAAYAYSAVKIVLDAMDRADSLTPDSIAQEIEGGEFDTAVGQVRIHNRELIVPMGMAVYQDGKLVSLQK